MKRIMIALAGLALSACGGAAQDDDDLVEEPAEDVYESVSDQIRAPMEEAEEVEAILQERANAVEEALEDQTGD